MWLEHLMLQPDGVSDPPSIRVRACEGINAVNYLDPGTFVRVLFSFYLFIYLFIKLKFYSRKCHMYLDQS